MRYSILLLTLLGISACATTETSQSTSHAYLVPFSSRVSSVPPGALLLLPGDTTTVSQVRYLSASR
jgi:hypothetical protein